MEYRRLREEANGYLVSLGRTVKRKIRRIRRKNSKFGERSVCDNREWRNAQRVVRRRSRREILVERRVLRMVVIS
jgi:hypothetical protein